MRRVPIPELLDSDSGTSAEIATSLSDLRRINLWFGGVSTTEAMIERVSSETRRSFFTLLDVASGSGFVANTVRQRAIRRGVQLKTTLLDRSRSHLNGTGNSAVVADALSLPFRNESFDLVGCGQFVHHLEPDSAVRFVEEALRVSRVAVLIHDVVRHPVHLALVYAGLPLFRSRLTRHDAPASVRQAYTVSEMQQLLHRTSAVRVDIARHYLFRMGVIAWKA
jgi:SAM-dependent methyltransferase